MAKPWRSRSGELFDKSTFKLDLGRFTITCPAGQTEKIRLGTVVRFAASACDPCPLRSQCTKAALGRGRSVAIADDERLQKKVRLRLATPSGREQLRERVGIEHHARKQYTKARYRGARKNVFDARRHATLVNLEQLQLAEAA